MYVQIASVDIYICLPKLYTKYNKPSNLKVPTKSKARSLRTSLWLEIISTRTLESYTDSLKQQKTCEKTCSAVHFTRG